MLRHPRGATTSFFTPTADLAGWDISVTVTATNDYGSSYASRAADAAGHRSAAGGTAGSPRVTGENSVGQTLTTDTGIWTGFFPITFAIQWKRCDAFGNLTSCVAIAGATGRTYVLQQADLGLTIGSFVTATNAVGSVTQFSNHTFPTLPTRHFAPTVAALPQVTGTPRPGFLLRATVGTWSGDVPQRLAYQWQRCDATGSSCLPIPRASKNRYTVAQADLGSTLRVHVTSTNAYGVAFADSAATDPITRAPKRPRGRHIVGTNGADYLAGGGGNDSISGRGGNDTIKGGAGSDSLDGGAGNDVIDGGPGGDRIQGGAGSDTILAADGVVDVIDCGDGNDRAVVDRNDKVVNCESVTYATPAPSGTGGSSAGSRR